MSEAPLRARARGLERARPRRDPAAHAPRSRDEQLDAARAGAGESGGRLTRPAGRARHRQRGRGARRRSASQLGLPVRPQIARRATSTQSWSSACRSASPRRTRMLPLGATERGTLRVAVSDPLDTDAARRPAPALRRRRGRDSSWRASATILGAINEVYDRGPDSTDALAEDAAEDLAALASEISQEPQDLLEASDDAPDHPAGRTRCSSTRSRSAPATSTSSPSSARSACASGSTTCSTSRSRRCRKALQASIVSRIKIMGGLNIAEKRLPQDGRIRLKIAGRDYDVRLSTVPVSYGERVVMRLLPRTQEMLEPRARSASTRSSSRLMEKLIARPNGIMLVTGPTGSGKTTTLYARSRASTRTDKNIITIEDPVEIQLPGHRPDRGEPEDRAHLRQRAALGPAPGPERDPGRRDPRPRDGGDRDPGLAHRPPGVLDAAHQRRAERDHAARRHGRRAVPGRLLAGRRARPAAGARALHGLPRAPTRPRPRSSPRSACGRPTARCGSTGPRAARAATTPATAAASAIFELMLVDDEIRALVTQNVDSKTIKTTGVRRTACTRCAPTARARCSQGVTSVAEVLRATEEEGVVAQIYLRPSASAGLRVQGRHGRREERRAATSTPRARARRAREAAPRRHLPHRARREAAQAALAASATRSAASRSRCRPSSASRRSTSRSPRASSRRWSAPASRWSRPCGALTEQVENARLKGVLGEVRDRVNEGTSLADAMAQSQASSAISTSAWCAPARRAARSSGARAPRRLPREPGAAAEQGQLDPDLSRS